MTDSYTTPGAPESAPEPPAKQKNTIGLVALIVGALGFLFACIPGALIVGWILLPIAFILSIVGLAQSGKPKGKALTALILSIVGTIVGVLVFTFAVGSAIDDAFSDDVEIGESQDEDASDEGPAEEEPAEEEPADGESEEDSGDSADGTRGNPADMGATISSSDWEVRLIDFQPDVTDEVLEVNQFNEEPEEGNVYAVAEVEATYIGDDSGTPWVDISVAYVTESGNTTRTSDHDSVGLEPDFMDIGELYEGASGSGYFTFEIPEGDDGLIRITPGMFADEVFVKTQS